MTPQRSVLLLLMALSLRAGPASAFVQYKSCDDTCTSCPEKCRDGQEPQPLRWFAPTLDVWFNTAPPENLDPASSREVVRQSFAAWSGLECDGTATAFTFGWPGERPCAVGYDDDVGAVNESCVLWVTNPLAWLHGGSVLALTSLTFNDVKGQIIDADLEFNDAHYQFVIGDQCVEDQIDLANTATHECGHVLGLDHSKVDEATMNARAHPCTIFMRDLIQDDVDGYCSLYGPSAPPIPTPGVPPSPSDPGCDATGSGSGGGAGALLLLLGLLAFPVWSPRLRSAGQRGRLPA